VVEHLPGKHQPLDSILDIGGKKKEEDEEARSENQEGSVCSNQSHSDSFP
jgi:hypothetical protein